jgi:hypothetical protein
MNEKPVKLDMGFDEALRRMAQTPKKAIAAVAQEKQEAQRTALAVKLLKTATPKKGGAIKGKLVKKL